MRITFACVIIINQNGIIILASELLNWRRERNKADSVVCWQRKMRIHQIEINKLNGPIYLWLIFGLNWKKTARVALLLLSGDYSTFWISISFVTLIQYSSQPECIHMINFRWTHYRTFSTVVVVVVAAFVPNREQQQTALPKHMRLYFGLNENHFLFCFVVYSLPNTSNCRDAIMDPEISTRSFRFLAVRVDGQWNMHEDEIRNNILIDWRTLSDTIETNPLELIWRLIAFELQSARVIKQLKPKYLWPHSVVWLICNLICCGKQQTVALWTIGDLFLIICRFEPVRSIEGDHNLPAQSLAFDTN